MGDISPDIPIIYAVPVFLFILFSPFPAGIVLQIQTRYIVLSLIEKNHLCNGIE